MADALREIGVEVGDSVAVLLPKSPELLVAVLAIWRLGAVHVRRTALRDRWQSEHREPWQADAQEAPS